MLGAPRQQEPDLLSRLFIPPPPILSPLTGGIPGGSLKQRGHLEALGAAPAGAHPLPPLLGPLPAAPRPRPLGAGGLAAFRGTPRPQRLC